MLPFLFSYAPRWRTKLFFGENWVQAFPPDYRPWPMHALTFETPFTTARKERIKGWFFSIESDDQPVFLVSLPGLLQKASECLVTAPSYFFFVSFRNHQCPFWNHCFNKQQIMRRRLQNKRASQLRPLNSGKKRQVFLWGIWPPNGQSLTRFANAASLFSPHSICRGFQIPATIPNTIDIISNFSNGPLSITSRQTILRYLCAIQQEGKPECSIAAKQRTLGSKRKVHRICPSTSCTLDLACMRPRLAIPPIRPQYQHGRMA